MIRCRPRPPSAVSEPTKYLLSTLSPSWQTILLSTLTKKAVFVSENRTDKFDESELSRENQPTKWEDVSCLSCA